MIPPSDGIPLPEEIFGEKDKGLRQRGGETAGLKNLESFLEERCLLGAGYRKELGRPEMAADACSRAGP